jgi:DNA-binding NtrC family response regulator
MAETLRLVLDTPAGARQFLLTGADATIGRAEQCEIVIEDELVSSRHGIFRATARGFTYADLGSRNGSALARAGTTALVPLPMGEETPIGAGDVLHLGSAAQPVQIRVERGEAPFAPARALDRTLVASRPIADLLARPATEVVALAARALSSDTPTALAEAALAYMGGAMPGARCAVRISGAGFQVDAGEALPVDAVAAARRYRQVVQLDSTDEGPMVVAPLLARGSLHGVLAAWWGPGGAARIPQLDAVNVAASLVALGAAALTVRSAPTEPTPEAGDPPEPLGGAPAFLAALDLVRRLASADVAVLIAGETGSGKELFARAIHTHSARKRGPFVAINCGAIPASLLESELFGHVEGAFTGAARPHAGVFEQAHGGTLFLDEIGEMPLAMQAGILRALESGEIRRVGDSKSRHVDVRLVSASHRDIREMVAARAFREDLMYRIEAARVRIPPLRERGDDVLLLAHHFLGVETRRAKKKIGGFSPEALIALGDYSFPGNVRELKNEIARAVALTPEGGHVLASALSERLTPASGLSSAREARPRTLREAVELAERHTVEQALARAEGNVAQASRDLGLTRPGLYKVLVRLGLRAPAGAGESEA